MKLLNLFTENGKRYYPPWFRFPSRRTLEELWLGPSGGQAIARLWAKRGYGTMKILKKQEGCRVADALIVVDHSVGLLQVATSGAGSHAPRISKRWAGKS